MFEGQSAAGNQAICFILVAGAITIRIVGSDLAGDDAAGKPTRQSRTLSAGGKTVSIPAGTNEPTVLGSQAESSTIHP